MMLISLNQAKAHLSIDEDITKDDNQITLKIRAASAMVVNYLKSAADEFLDSSGEVEVDSNDDPVGVPPVVYAATCLLVEDLYRNRGGVETGMYGPGDLPRSVTAILYPLRDPALR